MLFDGILMVLNPLICNIFPNTGVYNYWQTILNLNLANEAIKNRNPDN